MPKPQPWSALSNDERVALVVERLAEPTWVYEGVRLMLEEIRLSEVQQQIQLQLEPTYEWVKEEGRFIVPVSHRA